METAQCVIGADMARKGWCKCRAHKAVRKGANIPVEIGSGIEKGDRPGVTKE